MQIRTRIGAFIFNIIFFNHSNSKKALTMRALNLNQCFHLQFDQYRKNIPLFPCERNTYILISLKVFLLYTSIALPASDMADSIASVINFSYCFQVIR